jgi:hypothetical protein
MSEPLEFLRQWANSWRDWHFHWLAATKVRTRRRVSCVVGLRSSGKEDAQMAKRLIDANAFFGQQTETAAWNAGDHGTTCGVTLNP